MKKSPEAFRTISEVAHWLETPTHVLRFWESRFPEVAPVKRAGGRRYYRPEDMQLLGGIKHLLHTEGHTIKAVQSKLEAEGAGAVAAFSPAMNFDAQPSTPHPQEADQSETETVAASELDLVTSEPEAPAQLEDGEDASETEPTATEPTEETQPSMTASSDPDENFATSDTSEPLEMGAPPIGFFFDDSAEDEDALETPEALGTDPDSSDASDEPQTAFDDAVDPPRRTSDWTLDQFQDDPDEDSHLPGPAIPLSAVLRSLTAASFPRPSMRATLASLRYELDALHNRSE